MVWVVYVQHCNNFCDHFKVFNSVYLIFQCWINSSAESFWRPRICSQEKPKQILRWSRLIFFFFQYYLALSWSGVGFSSLSGIFVTYIWSEWGVQIISKDPKILDHGPTWNQNVSSQRAESHGPVEIISHWHPNLTINMVDDHTAWVKGSVPPPLDQRKFLPSLHRS